MWPNRQGVKMMMHVVAWCGNPSLMDEVWQPEIVFESRGDAEKYCKRKNRNNRVDFDTYRVGKIPFIPKTRGKQ